MTDLLSLEHLITLAIVGGSIAALVAAVRRSPGPWTVPAGRMLAVIILANEIGWWVWLAIHHTYSASYALPFQLCDVVAFVAVAALWTRRPLLVELTYFWGLAGTANGLVSPDVSEHFPAYLFLQYFIQHGAIVAAALFLVVGLRLAPRPWASARVLAVTVGLLLFDSFVNLVTDGNYLYLRHTPGVHSVLDLMGAWPWYIVGGAGMAIVLFAVLDLPFIVTRRARSRNESPAERSDRAV
jgi:hypothetical integral membrane protein (TIGR02206 family)